MKRKTWYLTLLPLLLVSCTRAEDTSTLDSANSNQIEDSVSSVSESSDEPEVEEAFDALPKGYKLSTEVDYQTAFQNLGFMESSPSKLSLKINDGSFSYKANRIAVESEGETPLYQQNLSISKLNLDFAAVGLELPAQQSQFTLSLDFTLNFQSPSTDGEEPVDISGDIQMRIDFTDNTLYIHLCNEDTRELADILYSDITGDGTEQDYPEKFKYPNAIPEDNTMTFEEAIKEALMPSDDNEEDGEDMFSGTLHLIENIASVFTGELTYYTYDDGSVAMTNILDSEKILANYKERSDQNEETPDSSVEEEEEEPTSTMTADIRTFKGTEYYANESAFLALDCDMSLSESEQIDQGSSIMTLKTDYVMTSKLRLDISMTDTISVSFLDDYSDYVLLKTGGDSEPDPDTPPISVAP